MAYMEYHTTERDRVCKMCNTMMARGTWGIVMRDVHVPPKIRDIHFHEGCFMRALDSAKLTWGQRPHDAKESNTVLGGSQIGEQGSGGSEAKP
jgi:hypothetical protein